MPYLNNTKLAVTFENIKINTERQLFEGKIVTRYDQTERNVTILTQKIKAIVNQIKKVKAIVFDKKKGQFVLNSEDKKDILQTLSQKTGSIVVEDENNKQFEISLTEDKENFEIFALEKGISSSVNDTTLVIKILRKKILIFNENS